LLIGLGASSISDAKYAYAQNEKKVETYSAHVHEGEWAVVKGHNQTEEDRMVKRAILDIACQGRLDGASLQRLMSPSVEHSLNELEADGLIQRDGQGLTVTPVGRIFIRNICSVFDLRMHRSGVKGENVFSRAV
jgi:oxygen-independent coproporphyrinogen-3 oxidase